MKKKICLLLSCMLCVMGISNVSAYEDWTKIVEFPKQISSTENSYVTIPDSIYGFKITNVYYQQVELSKEDYDEIIKLNKSIEACSEASQKYYDYQFTEDKTLTLDEKLDELGKIKDEKCKSNNSDFTTVEELIPKYVLKNWVETKKETIDGKSKYQISSGSYSYGVYYVKLITAEGYVYYNYTLYSSTTTKETTTETEVKTDTKTETTTEVKENTVKNPKTGMNNAYLVLPVVAGVGVLAFLVSRRKNKFPQA